MACQIIELESYRRQAQRSMSQRFSSHAASAKLRRMKSIIATYQDQMNSLAERPHIQKFCQSKGISPQEQIASDVARLTRLRNALQVTLEEKGAQDLPEATQLLRYWAAPEVIQTLDCLLASDYDGFQEMSELLVPYVKFTRTAKSPLQQHGTSELV